MSAAATLKGLLELCGSFETRRRPEFPVMVARQMVRANTLATATGGSVLGIRVEQ